MSSTKPACPPQPSCHIHSMTSPMTRLPRPASVARLSAMNFSRLYRAHSIRRNQLGNARRGAPSVSSRDGRGSVPQQGHLRMGISVVFYGDCGMDQSCRKVHCGARG